MDKYFKNLITSILILCVSRFLVFPSSYIISLIQIRWWKSKIHLMSSNLSSRPVSISVLRNTHSMILKYSLGAHPRVTWQSVNHVWPPDVAKISVRPVLFFWKIQQCWLFIDIGRIFSRAQISIVVLCESIPCLELICLAQYVSPWMTMLRTAIVF